MTRNYSLACIAAVAFMGAGCASDQASSRAASAALLSTPASQDANRVTAAKLGQGAAIWGDKHTATQLFARAEQESSTPLNRFNLATVYQQTGRTGDALELYASVVKDGKGVRAISLTPASDRYERTRRYDLAEESQARISAYLASRRDLSTASTGDEPVAPISAMAAARLDAMENPLQPRLSADRSTRTAPFVAETGAAGRTPG